MEIAVMLAIVCIHEMGHLFMAMYLKWRIRRIMLWIFGGVMETEEHGNRPIAEEALVVLAGPLQHLFIYLLLLGFGESLLPASVLDIAFQYNIILLLFNLLPIYPLDGGKLLSLVLASVMPYRRAHAATLIFSICCGIVLLVIQLLYFSFVLTTVCLIGFLLVENRLEWKQRYYVFLRFLLKRNELPSFPMTTIQAHKKDRLIDILSLFRRNRLHRIQSKDEGWIISEEALLAKYFSERNHSKTFAEIPTVKK